MRLLRRGAWAILVASVLMIAGDAMAVVGRPLTPVSYAGVARRTTRRSVYATSGAYGGYGAYGGVAPITTLPAGCMRSAAYYSCGGTYYKPVYDGPDVTYVTVNNP